MKTKQPKRKTILVRLPVYLHKALKHLATEEEVSVNYVIERAIGAYTPIKEITVALGVFE